MNNCRYITGFQMEPDEDGDPIFCDAPATIKFADAWWCAEHYDEIERQTEARRRGHGYIYRQGSTSSDPDTWGIDVSTRKESVFSAPYGDSD